MKKTYLQEKIFKKDRGNFEVSRSYNNRREQSGLNGCCTAMWKTNENTTTLLLFLDSLFLTFCIKTAFYNGLLKERYKGG
jgi:hypothetical protein